MSRRDTLLTEIECFVSERGIAETTFGLLAVNDGKLVPRLRAGKNIGLNLFERVEAFISTERQRAAEMSVAS